MAESLTVSEVAGKLSCSGQTVRALIKKGALPAFRVGREFRVAVADLNALRVAVSEGQEGGGHE